MTTRYSNPFAGIELLAPTAQREDYDRYVFRSSNEPIDESPFPRRVDLWFLSVCIAATENLSPLDLSQYDTYKFMDGQVLSSDPWRINILMLISIAWMDDIEIIAKPRQVIQLTNSLAASGFSKIIEMLHHDRNQEPIWNLSEAIEAKIKKVYKQSF